MPERGSSEYLSTLERGLRVLRCFSREKPTMSLSDVARATELSPAVARRCLLTLTELGYVGKEDGRFMLRPAVLQLSTPFIESFNIENVIRPPLQQLRNSTGDSASFAVLTHGGDILYISHVSTYRVIRLQATTGTRFPALATSLGRAILSALPEGEIDAFLYRHPLTALTDKTLTDPGQLKGKILEGKQRGYVVVSDELDYGITSISCPVIVPGRGVVGAINSSGSTGRVDLSSFAESRFPHLQRAQEQLIRELAAAPQLLSAIRIHRDA